MLNSRLTPVVHELAESLKSSKIFGLFSNNLFKSSSLPSPNSYEALRKSHTEYIKNGLSKHFYDERLQVDVKTYEMNSGMYVTYFKNLYPNTKHKLPLVIVGDPILSSVSILNPPAISTLLKKYSRIYIVDLPGVGLNNEKKLVESYLPFRNTLPLIDPNFRIRKSRLNNSIEYLTDFEDHHYLDKIDKIREFYFDKAFDEFITEHQFQKVDMLTISVSSYFVINFFENCNKSVVDKLYIVGNNPLKNSIFSIDRANPRDVSVSQQRIYNFKDTMVNHNPAKNTCMIAKMRSEVLNTIRDYIKFGDVNKNAILYDFFRLNAHMLEKTYEKHFDPFVDVTYNLFAKNFYPFENYLFVYEHYNKFININSFEVVDLENQGFMSSLINVQPKEYVDFKNKISSNDGTFLDGNDANVIIGLKRR